MERNLESHLGRNFGRTMERNRQSDGLPELMQGLLVGAVGGAFGLLATGVRALSTESLGKEKKPEHQEAIREEEVKLALINLGSYSDTVDTYGKKVLEYLSSHFKEISICISAAGSAILFLNLIRYLHEQLSRAVDEGGRGDGELHIVLVGDGSISNQVRPANWLVPLSTIRDTILYPPYDCAIDAKVAYGISTGSIRPEHRDFSGQEEQQEPLPDHWNSMAAKGRTGVPEIILGPTKSDADWITQVMALADSVALFRNRKRLVIPYPPGGVLARWLPAVSLDMIITGIALLLKFIPPYKATVHLAAGLEYRGTPPPDVEMWQDLYAYGADGTVMTTQNLELREYPMLYSVLRSMFLRRNPQYILVLCTVS